MNQTDMKHLCFCSALAVAALLSVSCERDHPLGGWDPIEVDKPEVHFASGGGEETVTALNYGGWWLNFGYEGMMDECGFSRYINEVGATSTDGREAFTYDLLDGGWYHAAVPNKGRSNELVITVDQNTTSTPRKAFIKVQAGDAFGSVRIIQD